MVLIDMVPTVVIAEHHNSFYLLITFIGLFILEKVMIEELVSLQKYKVILLLFIHAVLDGIIIISGFLYDTHVGLLFLLFLVLHRFLDGYLVSSYTFSNTKSWRKTWSVVLAFVIVTLLSLIAISSFNLFIIGSTSSVIYSIVTGIFLYIIVVDLIPKTLETDKNKTNKSIFFVTGMIIFILFHSLGHTH
ncbi:hypothetical protein M3633_21895 [Cytobacillus kochii]|nr:hypothetical protein [Cytobacillus kochii]